MHLKQRWARGVLPVAMTLFFSPLLPAQPQLSTIDDIIYRADGGRFEGTALIEWRSFLLADYTTVAAYSKSVRIINGSLRVSLAPTSNAVSGSHYQVRYVSNGRVMFVEYWSVPPGTSTLKLRDVRLLGPPMPQNQDSGVSGPVTIPDVTGLSDELLSRVRKGLGYIPSSAAVINSSGDLEGAVGDPNDCLRVNGTSTPCSVSSGPLFSDNETPAGLVNGSNNTFTLANAPSPVTSLLLYRNGLLQKSTVDYSLAGNVVTFLAGAIPQTGDLLVASYRLPGSSGQTGGSGSNAPSVTPSDASIYDQHVAAGAAIQESKLALSFPSHSNANDPSPEQKAALTGTAGTPSGSNRYVTNQDTRLSDARQPVAHSLLSGSHSDTGVATVSRGDIIVGSGTAPTLWTRLPLGASNRCLTSNGFDAVWNACLYTGFSAGAIPFVDGSGNLSQNQTRLYWDNSTRRLGVGVNAPTATLSVHDASTGDGVTTLSVRAGDNQQSTPLQRWQNGAATDLARVENDGALFAAAVQTTSTTTRPAWQETGSSADPTSPSNGSAWLNTTESAHKTREASQTHATPQVLCSIAGISTSNNSMTSLGTCTIPSSMLRPGDRIDIRAELTHEGTSTSFSTALSWGSQNLIARSGPGSETWMSTRSEVLPAGTSLFWNWQTWGSTIAHLSGGSSTTGAPAGNITIDMMGQMSSSTSETLTLRNLTVLRYPAQANP